MLKKKRKDNKVTIIFENDSLKKTYDELPNTSYLKKRIDYITERINSKPNFGQPIAKKLIPKEYKDKGFNNAFWVELSKQGWRLIYSLKSPTDNLTTAIILEWFTSHKDYEKRFGY